MKKHSGLFAVLMTILLCISMLGSVLIIAEHTHHDCTGEGCAVCMVLEQCDERVRTLGTAVSVFLMLLCVMFTAVSLPDSAVHTISSHTPITLKVKLLN
ncbi:MAG: hypothetical protein IJ060_09980 [Oscillospiraceae bacterium]|nr:hypothetical protein [Oscillospiraceae bacterium]